MLPGRRNGRRAGQSEKRQMGAVVVTGEDVDFSHCRCENERCRNDRGKDKWMKERGAKTRK